MTDEPEYRPTSAFLCSLIDEEPPLEGDAEADARAAQLIALTQDADPANRDWALMLLAQSERDDAETRAALVAGLDDENHDASLEALIGVAIREPLVALPRVAALLDEEGIDTLTLEAAAYVADASLLPALEGIRDELGGDGDMFDQILDEAIECCTRGTPPEPL
ncbi:lyase [Sphingomonas sp. CJ20]